jgi:hypothetical protein
LRRRDCFLIIEANNQSRALVVDPRRRIKLFREALFDYEFPVITKGTSLVPPVVRQDLQDIRFWRFWRKKGPEFNDVDQEQIVGALTKALLLFVLNWLDAQLTIVWVRMNVATEGNGLMGQLLDHSEASFLSVKLCVGALAGYILYRCADIPIARRGMKLVLGIYLALMVVHAATGFYALGWQVPATVISVIVGLPGNFLAFLS